MERKEGQLTFSQKSTEMQKASNYKAEYHQKYKMEKLKKTKNILIKKRPRDTFAI